MTEPVAVSVVISTYNRAAVLPRALESIVSQDVNDFVYEIIVVDNNSNDNTRSVIESYLARGGPQIRYVFERQQGVSFGRNAGIAASCAPIIAFFDDDVFVPRDWLATIKKIMDQHPEVDFIGGKVLPEWPVTPPPWLTPSNWSPLALVDYGPTPCYVSQENQLCLVGANLTVRRSLLESIGKFSPDLQRVRDTIGSMEDHELLIRAWRAGKRGLYAPDVVVRTSVPETRMTKAYHRRWHSGHGFFCAMIRTVEHDGDGTTGDSAMLFGVPGFVYRQLAGELLEWVVSSLRRQDDLAFAHESKARFFASYIASRCETERDRRSAVLEVARFANKLVKKKVRSAFEAGREESA
jgi:glycosyltransferase involved in cell wall biosynthesis